MSPKIFITATLTLALFLGTSSATQLKSRSLKQVLAQKYNNGYWDSNDSGSVDSYYSDYYGKQHDYSEYPFFYNDLYEKCSLDA